MPSVLGQRGQIAVLGGSDISGSSSTFSGSSATRAGVTFSPEVDYFVARNISVGLDVDVSYRDNRGYGADSSLVETKAISLAFGPRIGVNIPLGQALSLYPRATVGLEWRHTDEQLVSGESLSIATPSGYPSTSQFGPYIEIYAPLVLRLTDHLLIGVGPGLFHDFGTVSGGPAVGGQRTEIYGGLVVGGYFGGETVPSQAPQPELPPTAKTFGGKGQIVISNDLEVSGQYWTYAGTDTPAWNAGIGGSLDYFVADHLSVGFEASGSTSSVKGTDASTGEVVTNSNSALSFGPRLGVNIGMGRYFSVYPLITLGIEHDWFDERSAASANKGTDDIIYARLFVPILVHPAPHMFVGFGPSLYCEPSHSVSYPDNPQVPAFQNEELTVGASLIVGGWLGGSPTLIRPTQDVQSAPIPL